MAALIGGSRKGWLAIGGSVVLEVEVVVARRAAAIATAAIVMGTLACLDRGLDPLAKSITATYDSAVSFQFDNGDSSSTQNPYLSVLGEMTFVINDGDGDVHGTYSYQDHPRGSGTFAGTISADGTIAIRQFGDPDKNLGVTLQFLYNNWPNCDFAHATPMHFNASAGDGGIELVGTLTVSCAYTVHGKRITLPTTMLEALVATRSTGTSGLLRVAVSDRRQTETRSDRPA